ncbi:MAG: aspartate-semialdehyde dehydrogenase [Spirochaetales bacterium]|nr:aspartate-semialdehyde dehydrogenase [Spirochaetales bacterium]
MSQKKIHVAVIGATGMVGQQYLSILSGHPWFEVTVLAASAKSAGRTYGEAVRGRWHLEKSVPEEFTGMMVIDALDIKTVKARADLVFSAISLSPDDTIKLEDAYASEGLWVVSNNSAHRNTPDVPMIIPEVNPGHLAVLKDQRRRLGKGAGGIAVKPNCSIQGFVMTLAPLYEAGWVPSNLITTNFQAVSGAGYPGQASLDVIDNCLPLPGEEHKTMTEPLKIFGRVQDGRIVQKEDLRISAHCMRVPVIHGHLSAVSLGFAGETPGMEKVISLWKEWMPLPQSLKLPSAPLQPIHVFSEPDRPQHRLDRDIEKGMAAAAGRLRECSVLDLRYTCLSHNTIRGAAGGAILTAELMTHEGYVTSRR